jgi:serine/threonine protein kinase
MATVNRLLHPIEHHREKKEGARKPSGPLHDRNDSAMDKPREEEKRTLAQWEAQRHTLSPDEIDKDPAQKAVGHSSKVLRQEDFELIKTLGTGTFARVWLVRLKDASKDDYDKVFALKILRKVDVIRLKQVEHVRNERNVLAKVAGHPFITTMVASFQSLDSLYMVVRLTLVLRQTFSNVPSSTIALVVKSSAT